MRLILAALSLILLSSFIPADNVLTRFKTPAGYARQKVVPGSFAEWLQRLPLKPVGTHTQTYIGAIAHTDIETAAVVDISVGKQDLQQCADVVMRLRGEYLYQAKRYSEISFSFVSGFKCDYIHYANGFRYHNDSPGHCFIVMDVVENSQHKKQFLLAQSFMPAQNLQVLQYDQGQYWFTMDKITNIWYRDLVTP
jgi:hypothetical protein